MILLNWIVGHLFVIVLIVLFVSGYYTSRKRSLRNGEGRKTAGRTPMPSFGGSPGSLNRNRANHRSLSQNTQTRQLERRESAGHDKRSMEIKAAMDNNRELSSVRKEKQEYSPRLTKPPLEGKRKVSLNRGDTAADLNPPSAIPVSMPVEEKTEEEASPYAVRGKSNAWDAPDPESLGTSIEEGAPGLGNEIGSEALEDPVPERQERTMNSDPREGFLWSLLFGPPRSKGPYRSR